MHVHFHIDLTTLADGTYELVPEYESEQREAQVNLTKVQKSPMLAPLRKASHGACPVYFKFMQLIVIPIDLCI